MSPVYRLEGRTLKMTILRSERYIGVKASALQAGNPVQFPASHNQWDRYLRMEPEVTPEQELSIVPCKKTNNRIK